MKKIVLTGDKKTMWLISLAALLMLTSIYLMSADLKPAFAKYGMDINILPFFILGVIAEAVVFALIMNQFVSIIHFNENGIGFGIFNQGKIGYKEIKKVKFDNKIELITGEKTKAVKVIYFEENKEKYKDLLDTLGAHIKKSIKTENLYESIVQSENAKYSSEDGKKIAINGILIIFAIYMIYMPISYITIILRPPEAQNSILMTAFYGLLCVLGIITAIYFFRKKPEAVIIMKIYFAVAYFGGLIINILNSVLINGNQFSLLSIAGPAYGIISYFIIIRYLNISKRVQATFAK